MGESLILGTFGAETDRGLPGDPDATAPHYNLRQFFNLAGMGGWLRKALCIASSELTAMNTVHRSQLGTLRCEP